MKSMCPLSSSSFSNTTGTIRLKAACNTDHTVLCQRGHFKKSPIQKPASCRSAPIWITVLDSLVSNHQTEHIHNAHNISNTNEATFTKKTVQIPQQLWDEHHIKIKLVLNTWYPFNGLFSRTTWVSRYQKGSCKTSLFKHDRQEMTGFWDAMASAGPYANNLHLAPDR